MRAPYRLYSDGVEAETCCGDSVRRKAALQVGWSALHRVFGRPMLKRDQLQKKTGSKISKLGVW
jgi:hypothetical protein